MCESTVKYSAMLYFKVQDQPLCTVPYGHSVQGKDCSQSQLNNLLNKSGKQLQNSIQ